MDTEKIMEFLEDYKCLCKKHGMMFSSDGNRVWIVEGNDRPIRNEIIGAKSVQLAGYIYFENK